jgi:hypothetical protein
VRRKITAVMPQPGTSGSDLNRTLKYQHKVGECQAIRKNDLSGLLNIGCKGSRRPKPGVAAISIFVRWITLQGYAD